MFDDHPFSTQLLPIQLVHGIISITIVLEFNKPIPIFKVDFHKLSISAEKSLNIFFADMIAQSSNIYTRHAVDVVPGVGTSFYCKPS